MILYTILRSIYHRIALDYMSKVLVSVFQETKLKQTLSFVLCLSTAPTSQGVKLPTRKTNHIFYTFYYSSQNILLIFHFSPSATSDDISPPSVLSFAPTRLSVPSRERQLALCVLNPLCLRVLCVRPFLLLRPLPTSPTIPIHPNLRPSSRLSVLSPERQLALCVLKPLCLRALCVRPSLHSDNSDDSDDSDDSDPSDPSDPSDNSDTSAYC